MPKDLITSFWQFLNNSLNFIKVKKLQLEEMETVEGGVTTSISPCMGAMAEYGAAIGAVTQATNATEFWVASTAVILATDKVYNACNAM